MRYEDLKYLSFPLPEAIVKEKWSGHFDVVRQDINRLLSEDGILPSLKTRLELELNSLDHIQSRYTISNDKALELLRQRIPEITPADLEQLRREDKADWMYLNGEIRYINNFHKTLFKVYPGVLEEMAHKKGVIFKEDDPASSEREIISRVKDKDLMKAHIHIRHSLRLKDHAVRPGQKLHVHLPFPVERGSISGLRLIDASPELQKLPRRDSMQPTAYFEGTAFIGQEFYIEYEFDNSIIYRNMAGAAAQEGPMAYEDGQWLAEKPPHICFTPYLRAVCSQIVGREKDPLRIARKIYDHITTSVDYRFVRDYYSIDNISEYCAVNRKGDCGVQALLFITLCRMAGIPARWQSGLDAKPEDVGEHDWAMFFAPGYGWRYADLSYGGAAFARGDKAGWDFFFGNVDPLRIPVNDDFQAGFEVPKKHWRADPYDNQGGEAEYDDRGLTAGEYIYDLEPVSITF
ncbi:MAG: transglutaminase-like domain-containing protein [Anaerovoracaceae bacterium]